MPPQEKTCCESMYESLNISQQPNSKRFRHFIHKKTKLVLHFLRKGLTIENLGLFLSKHTSELRTQFNAMYNTPSLGPGVSVQKQNTCTVQYNVWAPCWTKTKNTPAGFIFMLYAGAVVPLGLVQKEQFLRKKATSPSLIWG